MAEHVRSPVTPAEAEEAIARIVRARRVREDFFPPELFSDPAWDMLLNLFLASLRQRPMAAEDLARAASVTVGTAVRWVDLLEAQALLIRRPGGPDDPVMLVELSSRGSGAIANWLRMWMESGTEPGDGARFDDAPPSGCGR